MLIEFKVNHEKINELFEKAEQQRRELQRTLMEIEKVTRLQIEIKDEKE